MYIGVRLTGGMGRSWRWSRVRISVPAEQRAEAKVLDYGEFRKNFGIVHFDHALTILVRYFRQHCYRSELRVERSERYKID